MGILRRGVRLSLTALLVAVSVVAFERTMALLVPDTPLPLPAAALDAPSAPPRSSHGVDTLAEPPTAPTAETLGLTAVPIVEAPPIEPPPPGVSSSSGGSVTQMVGVEVPCVAPATQHCAAAERATADGSGNGPSSIPAIAALATAAAVRPVRARRGGRRTGRRLA